MLNYGPLNTIEISQKLQCQRELLPRRNRADEESDSKRPRKYERRIEKDSETKRETDRESDSVIN